MRVCVCVRVTVCMCVVRVCVSVCVDYLGLLQGDVSAVSIHHAEGDALGLGGKHPADSGTGVANGDGDDAVAAGLDEELPELVSKLGDLINTEGD